MTSGETSADVPSEGIHQRGILLIELDEVIRALHLAPAGAWGRSRVAKAACGVPQLLGGDGVRSGVRCDGEIMLRPPSDRRRRAVFSERPIVSDVIPQCHRFPLGSVLTFVSLPKFGQTVLTHRGDKESVSLE
jgi:hypothetical protein